MTFYFYDLETSGVSPKRDRVMQFAGQRTDENLRPIGEADDFFIKLHKDVLPSPQAAVLTGLTPQKVNAEGLSEVDFLQHFYENIALPGTVFLGFNTIRFDDEFMRYMHFRNYYDPYEWQWKDDRSRWDMLDVVRMMRALRPEGLNWPVSTDGSASNRLESLTKVNNIEHKDAHTALADVQALISLSQKIRTSQPKLFDYLLAMRTKDKVKELVMSGEPFVYTSGSLESAFEKTTIAYGVRMLEQGNGALIYDARYDLAQWQDKSEPELKEAFAWEKRKTAGDRPPFKLLYFNKSPAVAPLGVIHGQSELLEKLRLDVSRCRENIRSLSSNESLIVNSLKALTDFKSTQRPLLAEMEDPGEHLYDGFVSKTDQLTFDEIHSLNSETIAKYEPTFQDERLNQLWPLYKARNYPKTLTSDEKSAWERYVELKLFSGGDASEYAKFLKSITEAASQEGLSENDAYVLQELQLYAESIAPY